MKKMLTLAGRNMKEILRDPLNLAFGLGFPLVLLFLLSAIQASVPVSLFEIDRLTPGIAVFGLAFMTLFSATLLSKDRGSALLQRLYTTPLRGVDFIAGYMLPVIPIALSQTVICYLAALILGLTPSPRILLAILLALPSALFFIALGLLCGSVMNDKQVGGICGALLTNVCAFMAGAWFDLSLVGGVFKKIADCLPFVHAVDMERAALAGDYGAILPHLLWVLAYMAVTFVLAVLLFLRQKKKQ